MSLLNIYSYVAVYALGYACEHLENCFGVNFYYCLLPVRQSLRHYYYGNLNVCKFECLI